MLSVSVCSAATRLYLAFVLLLGSLSSLWAVPPDLSLENLSISGGLCPDTSATVSLELLNVDSDTLFFDQDTVQLTLTQTGPQSDFLIDTLTVGFLAPGASMLYTFSQNAALVLPGDYVFQAWSTVANDLNPLNDSSEVDLFQPGTETLPFFEDFETFGIGAPGNLENGWTRTRTGTRDWSVNELDTPSSGTGPFDDHTPGTGAIYMFAEASGDDPGDTLRLVSPCLDLINVPDAKLEFWYHMYGSEMGTLQVAIRDAAGQETLLFSLSGEQQNDMFAAWLPAQIELGAFIGQKIQLVFRGIRGSGAKSDMAIDDILVSEPPAIDLGLVSLSAPVDLACPSVDNAVSLRLVQSGLDTLFMTEDTLFLEAQVSGPQNPLLRDTLTTGFIAPGDTLDWTFSQGVDLTSPGAYSFALKLSAQRDSNATNDTLTRQVLPALLVVAPYTEDFEGGFPAGWRNIPTDGGKDWRYSESLFAEYGPDSVDHTTGSGDYMWVDDTDPSSSNTQLWTPCLDLSGLTRPFVEFWVWSQIEDDQDEVLLHLDMERAETWQADVIPALISQGSEWGVLRLNLDSLVGEVVRFRFRAEETGSGFRHDVAIDDFRVYNGAAEDMNTLAFLGLRDSLCGGEQSFVEVVFRHVGADTLSQIPARLAVNSPLGTDTLALLIPGPLGFQQNDTVSFGPFDTSPGGLHSFTAWTEWPGESETGNDTLAGQNSYRALQAPAITQLDTSCVEAAVTLAGPSDPLFWYAWYDTPQGGLALDTGETYTTPLLSSSTDFYAEAIGRPLGAGPSDTTLGGGAPYAFFEDGLRFDVAQDMVLDGLRLFPQGSGQLVINLRDSLGQLLYSDTTLFGGAVGDTLVTLDWAIGPGLGYQIDAVGTTVTNLYRNNTGVTYPYEINNLFTLKGAINGLNGLYYFFYDWQVRAQGCPRPRGELTVIPQNPPQTSFTRTSFRFDLMLDNFSVGADSFEWTFGDGGTSQASNPVYSYADTGTYIVCLRSFNACGGDSLCQEVNIVCPRPVAAFEAEALGDNLASFTDLSLGADSVWFNFGGGQGSSDSLSQFDFGAPGLYTVQMVAFNPCGRDTFTAVVNIIGTAIKFRPSADLHLFPNPSTGTFTLRAHWPGYTELGIRLYGLKGELLRTWQQEGEGNWEKQWTLPEIPAGLYLLRIQTRWGTYQMRLSMLR